MDDFLSPNSLGRHELGLADFNLTLATEITDNVANDNDIGLGNLDSLVSEISDMMARLPASSAGTKGSRSSIDLGNLTYLPFPDLKRGSNLTANTTDGPSPADLEDFIEDLKKSINQGSSKLGTTGFYTLLIIYILVICVGISGNLLVLIAVMWRQSMRTPHNFFIAALALSDLFLCSFSMPVTMWDLLFANWPFGPNTKFLCRIVVCGQAVPLFMSSMAIVAIAWDRYRCVIQNYRYFLLRNALFSNTNPRLSDLHLPPAGQQWFACLWPPCLVLSHCPCFSRPTSSRWLRLKTTWWWQTFWFVAKRGHPNSGKATDYQRAFYSSSSLCF